MLNLAVLGAGRWGQRYIETIRSIDTLRLVALASRNPESAALVPPGCRIFSDWQLAITAPDVDAVVVATPPRLHAQMALSSIEAGLPVLIEKPLTLSVEDALSIKRSADQSGVLAAVGHTHLCNAGFRELKRQKNAVGTIRNIRSVGGNWGPFRRDVSPLWDWAPHDLSMCLNFVGELPEITAADRFADSQIEAGLAANYRLQLKFGAIDTDIQVGNLMKSKQRRFEVIGDDASLIYDDVAGALTLRRGGVDITVPFAGERPLAQLLIDFEASILKSNRQDPSLELGCEIVQIIAQCKRLTET